MGVTTFEIKLLNSIIDTYQPKNVLELGAQNNYSTNETLKPPFMSEWYEEKGIEYSCIDLAGDNNAIIKDLSKPLRLSKRFNLITDFGTSEHTVSSEEYETVSFHEGHIHSVYPKSVIDTELAYYNCWLNKHSLLKYDGIMISVNPLTGNWVGHGYSYINEDFYKKLCLFSDYKILELGTHAAMGNTKDGWNVYCVMQKKSEIFPLFYQFKKFPIFKK